MNKIKQTALFIASALFVTAGFIAIPANTASAAECGGQQTALISCPQPGQDKAEDGTQSKDIKDSGVWGVLIIAINILVGLVSVAALAGIVYGAVLYTSAGGNMEQTKKGMQIIGNVVIGLIAFALMYVGLNFLIPGGVFS